MLIVHDVETSDILGSGFAGQLSIVNLATATRWTSSCFDSHRNNEAGGVIGRCQEQSWIFVDTMMAKCTDMTNKQIQDLCSDHPAVVYSNDGVVLGKPFPRKRDGKASGLAPDWKLSPISPQEDRLLDSDVPVTSEGWHKPRLGLQRPQHRYISPLVGLDKMR